MQETRVDRGQEVTFNVTFFNSARAQIIPANGAEIRISYTKNGVAEIDTLPLVAVGGGVFTAAWNSGLADAGFVDWHAYSLDDHPTARDGRIIVYANSANPAPSN